jgi:hypothetical protein
MSLSLKVPVSKFFVPQGPSSATSLSLQVPVLIGPCPLKFLSFLVHDVPVPLGQRPSRSLSLQVSVSPGSHHHGTLFFMAPRRPLYQFLAFPIPVIPFPRRPCSSKTLSLQVLVPPQGPCFSCSLSLWVTVSPIPSPTTPLSLYASAPLSPFLANSEMAQP